MLKNDNAIFNCVHFVSTYTTINHKCGNHVLVWMMSKNKKAIQLQSFSIGVRATLFSDAMSFLQMQKFQVFTRTRVLLSWHKNTTCDNHLVVRCNAENNTINCCNLQYNIVFFSSVYLITSVSYICDHIAEMQNSHWIAKLPTLGYKSAILCIFLAKVHTILTWLRNNHWSCLFCC